MMSFVDHNNCYPFPGINYWMYQKILLDQLDVIVLQPVFLSLCLSSQLNLLLKDFSVIQ